MSFFYSQGKLKVGQPTQFLDVESLARQHATAGHPLYIYDLDDIEMRFRAMDTALSGVPHAIHYAMKANSHAGILQRLASLGAGVDTVSGGEIRRALESGVPADRIIFSGVAKTVAEIELALTSGIKQINVESPQELIRIGEIASRLKLTASVAFRLNPDVNPQTHPYITTGFRENKFGMDESFMPELVAILKRSRENQSLRLRGLTMHIGSLLFDLGVIQEAIQKTVSIHRNLLAEGFSLDRLDIGGGLGIHYETANTEAELALIARYGEMAKAATQGLDVELLTEPGRVLVGRAGLLIGEVQYVKATSSRLFAILNTGMHHLIRPALYSAKHRILTMNEPVKELDGSHHIYDVVGPICESSDFLAKSITLPEVRQGDLIAIADTGAYGFAMASTYNSHALPAEILISNARQL